MTRFLAAIGPMGEPPTIAWFLFPGDPDHPAVVAPSLSAALPELHRIARGGSILVEPALAARGAACGLSAGNWHDAARADFAAIALDIENRETFSRIGDSRLILEFCRAAAAFRARDPALGELALHLPGDAERKATVTTGPGLFLPDEPGGSDGLSVQLARGLAAVEDALQRATGLDRVPQAARLRGSEKLPLDEAELRLLSSALAAAAGPEPR